MKTITKINIYINKEGHLCISRGKHPELVFTVYTQEAIDKFTELLLKDHDFDNFKEFFSPKEVDLTGWLFNILSLDEEGEIRRILQSCILKGSHHV